MEEELMFEPQEFKVSISGKIFYGIFAAILILFSIKSVFDGTAFRNSYMWLFPVLCISGGVLLIVAFQIRKFTLNETNVSYVGLFSKKEFELSSIKGYRLHTKMIDIECFNGNKLTLYFHFDFSKCKEIENWLRLNFADLDALDLNDENDAFLRDDAHGFSEELRSAKLKTAKELALAYNIWGAIAGFIFIFFDQKFTFITLMIIPLLGIVLLYSNSLIKFFSEKSQSIYPFIFIGFGVPGAGLMFKTMDFSLINSVGIWIPVIIICAIMFLLILNKGINKKGSYFISETVITVVLVIIYCVGSFRSLNCAFDNSNVELVKVEVLGKKVRHGKGTYYGLILNKWGLKTEVSKEKVSRRIFNSTNIGDVVTLKLKKGRFNVPWYLLDTGKKENQINP